MVKYSLLHFRSFRVIALLGAVAILLSACAGLVKEDRFFKGEKGEIISLLKEAMSEKDHNKALSKAHLAVEKNRSVKDPYLPYYTNMAFSYIYQSMDEKEKGMRKMFKSTKMVMKWLRDDGPANILYNMGIILYDLRPAHLLLFIPYQEHLETLKYKMLRKITRGRLEVFEAIDASPGPEREKAKNLLDKLQASVNNATDGLLKENSQLLRESRKDMVYVLELYEELMSGFGKKLDMRRDKDDYELFLRVKEAAPTIYDVFLAYMDRDKSLYETSLRKSANLLNDVIKNDTIDTIRLR